VLFAGGFAVFVGRGFDGAADASFVRVAFAGGAFEGALRPNFSRRARARSWAILMAARSLAEVANRRGLIGAWAGAVLTRRAARRRLALALTGALTTALTAGFGLGGTVGTTAGGGGWTTDVGGAALTGGGETTGGVLDCVSADGDDGVGDVVVAASGREGGVTAGEGEGCTSLFLTTDGGGFGAGCGGSTLGGTADFVGPFEVVEVVDF